VHRSAASAVELVGGDCSLCRTTRNPHRRLRRGSSPISASHSSSVRTALTPCFSASSQFSRPAARAPRSRRSVLLRHRPCTLFAPQRTGLLLRLVARHLLQRAREHDPTCRRPCRARRVGSLVRRDTADALATSAFDHFAVALLREEIDQSAPAATSPKPLIRRRRHAVLARPALSPPTAPAARNVLARSPYSCRQRGARGLVEPGNCRRARSPQLAVGGRRLLQRELCRRRPPATSRAPPDPRPSTAFEPPIGA